MGLLFECTKLFGSRIQSPNRVSETRGVAGAYRQGLSRAPGLQVRGASSCGFGSTLPARSLAISKRRFDNGESYVAQTKPADIKLSSPVCRQMHTPRVQVPAYRVLTNRQA